MVPDFCSACSFIWGDPMKLIAFYGSSTRDKCRERRKGSVWLGWWIAHFHLASKPEEGRVGKQPHLAGSRRRHHMEMMESGLWPPERWMVFPQHGFWACWFTEVIQMSAEQGFVESRRGLEQQSKQDYTWPHAGHKLYFSVIIGCLQFCHWF